MKNTLTSTSHDTAYKGFSKDLTCLGFQYAEGETFTHDGPVAVCDSGFHAVELPLDVLTYYPLIDGNQYREVALRGVQRKEGDDSKVSASEITVGAALSLFGLIKAHVGAIWRRAGSDGTSDAATTGGSAYAVTTGYSAHAVTNGHYANAVTTGGSARAVTNGSSAHAATTGDCAHAVTTGRCANAATTGEYAHAVTTGYYAHAATTGDCANAATTGRYANAVTTGDYANAVTTGYCAHAATTGRYANAATTGEYAHAVTTGYYAHAVTTGDCANAATTGRYANAVTTGDSTRVRASVGDRDTVAAVLGQGAAKGVIGSWLVLTERDSNLGLLGVKAVQVDGETVKADTYYMLSDGEIEEADE